MARIFVSYSSSDRVIVESFAGQLREKSHTVWMDFDSIPGGIQWETEITKAIEQTQVCLVIVTPNSVESEWVKKEIQVALKHDKRIIPLIMYAVSLQDALTALRIDNLQVIDFDRYGYAISFERLNNTLDSIKDTQEADLRKLRALVIEDTRVQREIIQQVLDALGLETSTASNFDTAFDLVRKGNFDLVTLDMQLDEMDPGGLHGMLLLDQLSLQKNVQIIIISGLNWDGKQVRDFLIKYKAFDYLKKPVSPDELRDVISRALKET